MYFKGNMKREMQNPWADAWVDLFPRIYTKSLAGILSPLELP